MADKLTLSFSSSERDQLQRLAAQLDIKATRGPGARSTGSVSGLLTAVNDAYGDDPARILTMLARMLQGQRPDVFGYWFVGDQRFVVRWTAQAPKSKHGKAAISVVLEDPDAYPPRSPNGHDQYIAPDVVTEEDMQWLQESGVTVQRAEPYAPALQQDQSKLMLV